MKNRDKYKEFHFVVNHKLKNRLKSISILLNLSLSQTIIYILDHIDALLKKIHMVYCNEKSRYEYVGWDSHIHIYLEKDNTVIYNKLKSIHKDNNSYSIAGKLRYVLKVFLRGVEFYGLWKFMKILENADKRWIERIKTKKNWCKVNILPQLSYKNHLSIEYDKNYLTMRIKILN